MPFDSQGKFTRLHNWEDDRINDIDIVTDHADEEDDNFADGLSHTFLRDGRAPMTGDFNGGGFKIKNIAAGSGSNDAITYGQLSKAKEQLEEDIKKTSNNTWAVGDIKSSLRADNHGNWLLCNGQAVGRTEFASLFEIIGTNFGSGDGVNTFNVPDYRGKFLRGLGGNSAENIYTTQEEGLPNVIGTIVGGRANSKSVSGAFANDGSDTAAARFDGGNDQDTWFGKSSFDASRSSAVYGNSEHVTPINQAVNYFIKAKDE